MLIDIIPKSTQSRSGSTCKGPIYELNTTGILGMTLKCIRWWGSSSRTLRNMERPFNTIIFSPLCPGVVVPVRVLSMSQIELFNPLTAFKQMIDIQLLVLHSNTGNHLTNFQLKLLLLAVLETIWLCIINKWSLSCWKCYQQTIRYKSYMFDIYLYLYQTRRTLLEKQRRTHKWCTPMDPHIWPNKSRTTSSNIHSAAMWGYVMQTWIPARGDER